MKGFCTILVVVFFTALARSEMKSVVKRSDPTTGDSNALSAVVEKLAAELTQLKARLDAMEPPQIAFAAQFSADPVVTPPLGSPFKLDQVIFNDGNAYDPTLGIFSAPLPGVYIFSLQVFTYGPQRLVLDMSLNGNIAHRMAMDTNLFGNDQNGEDSDSATAILKLAKGDQVWVELPRGPINPAIDLLGSYHTFFNGALLYAL